MSANLDWLQDGATTFANLFGKHAVLSLLDPLSPASVTRVQRWSRLALNWNGLWLCMANLASRDWIANRYIIPPQPKASRTVLTIKLPVFLAFIWPLAFHRWPSCGQSMWPLASIVHCERWRGWSGKVIKYQVCVFFILYWSRKWELLNQGRGEGGPDHLFNSRWTNDAEWKIITETS